jgi:FKBP-type peptidyl-prolyl cis-trans isomerase
MKKRIGILMTLAILLFVSNAEAQKEKKSKNKEAEPEATARICPITWMDTISYIVGYDLGNRLKEFSEGINLQILSQALQDSFADSTSLFTPQQTDSIMTIFQNSKTEEMNAKNEIAGQENKAAAATFLAQNLTQEGVVETPSGLQYKIISPGTGDHPMATSNVTVHYRGMLLDGNVFDSSYDRNEPLTIELNGVIPGWTEGLQMISPGGQIILYIPPHLAYGDRDAGPIPPGSLLIFEVELLSFEN